MEDGLIEVVAAVDTNPEVLVNAQTHLGLPREKCYTDLRRAFAENEVRLLHGRRAAGLPRRRRRRGPGAPHARPVGETDRRHAPGLLPHRRKGAAGGEEDGGHHEPPLRPGQDHPARSPQVGGLRRSRLPGHALHLRHARARRLGRGVPTRDEGPADDRGSGPSPRYPRRHGGGPNAARSTPRPGIRDGGCTAATRRGW